MKKKFIFITFGAITVLLVTCLLEVVRAATPNYYTNPPGCPNNSSGTCSSGCPTSPTTQSSAGVGCAWVKIMAGPMRPGSSISSALFRMGENEMSESIYTPQTLNFVAGYAMKGVSHEVTAASAPRQVTMIQSAGVPFLFNFKDNESIGIPVFGDNEIKKYRLFMVDANGWTVLKEPAYYDLYPGNGERYRFNACKASPQYMQLVSHRTLAGREETYQDMGVEVIRDASQSLRQLLLPSRLADIVVTDASHYALKFYTLSSMAGGKDNNGCYRISSNAAPFETWSFANPAPGALRKLLVTRSMAGRNTVYDYTYNSDSENWTMTTGDGISVDRQEEDGRMWNDARTERWVTRSVKAGDGTLASRSTEKIQSFSWGDGVTRRVTETGEGNLTNLYTYTAAGLTESSVEPDGSWRWYRYDAAGRVTNEISAFKDSALTSVANAAHAVATSYAPVDSADSSRLNDQLPRMVTESILGTVVARTYRAFRLGTGGELQEIVEKAANPAAAYGDAGNLRTVTTYYGTNTANHQIGRVASVAHPDGRLDTYTYEYGTYEAGVGEIAPTFVTNSAGIFWCETVVHGTVANPEGVAGKTMKQTRILDSMSQFVLAETWVCIGGPNYERVAWTSQTFDEWQHPVLVRNSKGEKTEASWGGNCCGKEWEIGPDGVELNYGYNLLGRMILMTRKAANTNEADLVTTYTYDSEGRRLTETRQAGSLSQFVVANNYDLNGRLIASTNSQTVVTTYKYNGTSTTVIQGGQTNTTGRYLSGEIKASSENGTIKSFNDYGVNADGTRWSKSFTGSAGTNSPAWQKATIDLLGRNIKTEKPGYGGMVVASVNSFNTRGQLISTTQQPNNSTTLSEYDELGQQIRSGLDVNTNGVLDLAGPDRVNESATWFDQDNSGDYWQVRASIIYAGETTATPTTNSIQKTRLTGLGSSSEYGTLNTENFSSDLFGNQTTTRTYVDRNTKTVTQVVNYPDSTNAATQITINGLLTSSTSKTGVRTYYTYDSFGRQVSVSSPSPFRGEGGGEGARLVGSYTTYNSLGQVASTMDAASNTTTYTYDSLGRRIGVTDALSNTTYTAYSPEGQVLATWGATYPVAYDYDNSGRMIAMYTYRGTNALSSYSEINTLKSQMDRTRWFYDEATGLLTNKQYSDSKGPVYTYTPDGKLLTRAWARGVVTTYNYDSLGQLTNISYSDNTPAVTFAFDRLGRQTTITDAQGARTFTYNDAFQLDSEICNLQSAITHQYDALGRPVGFDAGPSYSVRYGFDLLGRFSAVSNNVGGALRAATYSYLQGSDIIQGYTTDDGFFQMKAFEPNRNLILSITNGMNGFQLRRFDYLNDEIGRRTQRTDFDISTSISNFFAYNIRSELEDATMGTNSFNYRYDPIGNRRAATNNAAVTEYLVNSLNQYSAISNQQSQISLSPLHDSDGNLTNYGAFAYAWDAENRLVSVSSNGVVVAEYQYDYMSRRVAKTLGGVTRHFRYDGWNLIREQDSAETNQYVWGLDLSGTLQGAGGIGGLLSATFGGASSTATVYYAFDANGNVSDLVAPDGSIVAHYTYDPYGNITAQAGELASINPFKFSNKYFDHETGFYYYGFRFYNPEIGRWTARDPLGEVTPKKSCSKRKCLRRANLQLFAGNAPTMLIDLFGLCDVCPEGIDRRVVSDDSGSCGYKYRTTEQNGQPEGNGCGSPPDSEWVFDSFFGIINFTPACDTHDRCYGRCGSTKTDCDRGLGTDMAAACTPLLISPGAYLLCVSQAAIYAAAVLALGNEPYEKAQNEFCKWKPCCFRPSIPSIPTVPWGSMPFPGF